MSLLLAIIGHLVGDYLLQNDWMALHKKKDFIRCAIHASIWSFSVLIFSGWVNANGLKGVFLGVLLVLTHFIQDHTNVISWWMDLIGQKQFRTGPCAPWSIIVVDNVWHIVTLTILWRLFVV